MALLDRLRTSLTAALVVGSLCGTAQATDTPLEEEQLTLPTRAQFLHGFSQPQPDRSVVNAMGTLYENRLRRLLNEVPFDNSWSSQAIVYVHNGQNLDVPNPTLAANNAGGIGRQLAECVAACGNNHTTTSYCALLDLVGRHGVGTRMTCTEGFQRAREEQSRRPDVAAVLSQRTANRPADETSDQRAIDGIAADLEAQMSADQQGAAIADVMNRRYDTDSAPRQQDPRPHRQTAAERRAERNQRLADARRAREAARLTARLVPEDASRNQPQGGTRGGFATVFGAPLARPLGNDGNAAQPTPAAQVRPAAARPPAPPTHIVRDIQRNLANAAARPGSSANANGNNRGVSPRPAAAPAPAVVHGPAPGAAVVAAPPRPPPATVDLSPLLTEMRGLRTDTAASRDTLNDRLNALATAQTSAQTSLRTLTELQRNQQSSHMRDLIRGFRVLLVVGGLAIFALAWLISRRVHGLTPNQRLVLNSAQTP